MKLFFAIFLAISVFLATIDARPTDDVVEIIKQKLVKFPEEDFNYEVNSSKKQQTSDEAERIMQAIEKINEAFGYKKKQKHNERRKYPTILDSSQYLYPQPSFFPFYPQNPESSGSNGENILQPSIRNLNFRQRSSVNFYPKIAEQQELPTHYAIPVKIFDNQKENRDNSFREYSPGEFKTNGYKIVGDVENFNTKSKLKTKYKTKSKFTLHPQLRLYFLPQQLVSDDSLPTLQYINEPQILSTQPVRQELNTRTEKLATHRPSAKVQLSSSASDSVTPSTASPPSALSRSGSTTPSSPSVPLPSTANQIEAKKRFKPHKESKYPTVPAQRHAIGNAAAIPAHATQSHPLKNAISSLFNRPLKTESIQHHNPSPTPVTVAVPQSLYHSQQQQQQQQQPQQPYPSPITYITDDYKWDDSSSGSSDDEELEKNIFGFKHKEALQETEKQALKEGGIIIQRLKVRKGGIAIAGPGGVATAGSGGTAIVGPGGYALTHPRSLTIAGPGAKVIAIPETTDLKDALLQTSIGEKNFPREGKIVATGPAIYYSPDSSDVLRFDDSLPFQESFI